MRAVQIPIDPAVPVRLVEVGTGYQSFAKAIGGPCQYIERVRCPLTTFGLVTVVDEDGLFNDQPPNPRAWPLYPVPGYTLHGAVLVMAEGMTAEGIDFVDLPGDGSQALALVTDLLERSEAHA